MVKISLFLFVTLLFHRSIAAQVIMQPRPLCLSQYTLANRACALVRRIVPSEISQEVREGDELASSSTNHHRSNGAKRHNHHGQNRGHDHHGDGNKKKRDHYGEHEEDHRGERQLAHRRHSHHHEHHDALTDECCRWLREVDSECVCDILVRLPLFLTRPEHKYVLKVGDGCTVTYNCTSRLLP